MDVYSLNNNKNSIKLFKIYEFFICLLISSALIGSKIFGIELAGFTLFMDRIILFIILFLFWPKIMNKIIANNSYVYLFLPMILIGLISLASQSILGINQSYVIPSIKYIVLYVEFALFVAVISIVQDKNKLNKCFVYIMMAVLVVGILESLEIDVLNLPIFRWLPKTQQQYADLNTIFYRGSTIRISSVYTHSLAFGTVLSLYIPYLFYLYNNKIVRRSILIISLILTNYCLFLTYSRTAIAITISFYIFMFIRAIVSKKQHPIKKIVLCLVVIIIFSFITNILMNNLDVLFPQGANDTSVEMRLEDYKFVKDGFNQSPILGLGAGSYRDNFNNAIDNFYLTTLYENGLIGLILLIIFIIINVNYLNKCLSGNAIFTIKYIFFMLVLYNCTMDAFGFIEIMKFYLIIVALSSKIEKQELIKGDKIL
ncbi:O-antigen ligase family protein [Paraclostridium dentum]|uniref:O-antigen ligase family protein n=1 Tax=Paraclostridium dentum TaxID=2662455 RepID=UPI003B00F08E